MNPTRGGRLPKADGPSGWPAFYRNPQRFPADLKRMLIIDDQDFLYRDVSQLLGPLGVRVKGAATGDEGMAIARVFLPDLIILDWILKEVSGETVARNLRKDPATQAIPTIMVSSIMEEGDAQRAQEAGAHLFLTKDQFRDVLNSYLPRKASGRAAVQRVLVIEDDDGAQDLIRCVLTGKNRTLAFAADARSGLKAARESPPALIILDLRLPDLNGVEVFKLLRSELATKSIPILLMSAMEDESGTLDSLIATLRPTDFIRKPFGADDFASRVARLLEAPPFDEAGPVQRELILRRGRIQVDLSRHEVRVEGRIVKLSPRLFVLLRILITQQESVSVERLVLEGWPEGRDLDVVKKGIQRLREALSLRSDPIVVMDRGYKLIG